MLDLQTRIANLRRPKLLVSAARFGLDRYNRNAALPRLLSGKLPERSGQAIMQLLEVEAELNEARRERAATYSCARHVEVLVALMGESAILRDLTARSRA